MINAKQELQEILIGKAKIKCAIIYNRDCWGGCEEKRPKFKLSLNYTDDDLVNFYNSLDFAYDNGYGRQELFGDVWLEDGSWLSRSEYDGSEWWEHNVLPIIPNLLLSKEANIKMSEFPIKFLIEKKYAVFLIEKQFQNKENMTHNVTECIGVFDNKSLAEIFIKNHHNKGNRYFISEGWYID